MDEIDEILDDTMEELKEKVKNYLIGKDREYRERAKIGVKIKRDLWTYMAYEVEIGGLRIYIDKDGRNHRWEFKDENTSVFYIASEKKGEEIIDFLKELAKLSSQSGPSQGENSFTSQGEENLAGAGADPEDLDEEIIGEDEEDDDDIPIEERII